MIWWILTLDELFLLHLRIRMFYNSQASERIGNIHVAIRHTLMSNVVEDQGAVNIQVPSNEGGGEVPVPVDYTGGADHVPVPIAAGGGDGPVHTERGDVMTEAADGGGRT